MGAGGYVLAGVIVAASAATANAQTAVEQRRPAPADGIVEIENASGTIKVFGWAQNEVLVKGTLGRGASGLELTGGQRQTRVEVETERNPHGVRSDLEVHVPAGSRLEIEAHQAEITVTGVKGGVHVETVNGGITARFGRADWAGTMKLTTVNGGIDLSIPDGLNAEVKASTVNGDISTDFPISVTGKFSKRKLSGTVGSGGRLLEMSTVNGGIELKKAAR